MRRLFSILIYIYFSKKGRKKRGKGKKGNNIFSSLEPEWFIIINESKNILRYSTFRRKRKKCEEANLYTYIYIYKPFPFFKYRSRGKWRLDNYIWNGSRGNSFDSRHSNYPAKPVTRNRIASVKWNAIDIWLRIQTRQTVFIQSPFLIHSAIEVGTRDRSTGLSLVDPVSSAKPFRQRERNIPTPLSKNPAYRNFTAYRRKQTVTNK